MCDMDCKLLSQLRVIVNTHALLDVSLQCEKLNKHHEENFVKYWMCSVCEKESNKESLE